MIKCNHFTLLIQRKRMFGFTLGQPAAFENMLYHFLLLCLTRKIYDYVL